MDSGTLRILIVDDEPEARELLKFILQEKDGLEVCGLASNVDEALALFRKEEPDLVFLDIQMPGKDGFQFIDKVRQGSTTAGIIFVTAFDHYAIQAIRESVFDYIMKPVRQEELFMAIERFREKRSKMQLPDLNGLLEVVRENRSGKVKLNTRAGYILLHPLEVVYCEADGNYTHIQMESGSRETTTQNLGSIENLLREGSFFRVSRSFLVNLKFLVRVDRKSSTCILEYNGTSASIKIPPPKIKLLEASFS